MSEQGQTKGCASRCWLISAVLGVLTAVLLVVIGHYTVASAVLLGALVFVIFGAVLVWMSCSSVAASSAPAAAAPAPAAPAKAETPVAATTAAAAVHAEPAEAAAPVADPAPEPAPAEVAAEPAAPVIKPSPKLAGEEDLASRKGTWRYEGGDTPAAAPASAKAAPAAAAAPAEAAPAVKPSAKLAGQEELATKKGEWRYEGEEAAGTKPEGLTAPRDGGADDLKKIKGIGPKLEQLCHAMGYFHFDQIAAWSADEVAWVDANLKGFKGRVTRDNWVEQASLLATGGETEFSKRVDKGDVY